MMRQANIIRRVLRAFLEAQGSNEHPFSFRENTTDVAKGTDASGSTYFEQTVGRVLIHQGRETAHFPRLKRGNRDARADGRWWSMMLAATISIAAVDSNKAEFSREDFPKQLLQTGAYTIELLELAWTLAASRLVLAIVTLQGEELVGLEPPDAAAAAADHSVGIDVEEAPVDAPGLDQEGFKAAVQARALEDKLWMNPVTAHLYHAISHSQIEILLGSLWRISQRAAVSRDLLGQLDHMLLQNATNNPRYPSERKVEYYVEEIEPVPLTPVQKQLTLIAATANAAAIDHAQRRWLVQLADMLTCVVGVLPWKELEAMVNEYAHHAGEA